MSTALSTAQADSLTSNAIARCLAAGHRVLLAGSPPGSFPDKFTRHPRLIVWSSSEPRSDDGHRVIPAEVGAVLMTRMMSHALSSNLRQQARQRSLIAPVEMFSPGAIVRLLEPLLAAVTPTRKDPKPMPTIKEAARVIQKPVPTPPAPAPSQAPEEFIQDPDVFALVQAIDDSIAALQLVREQALRLGTKLGSLGSELETLAALRRLLK